MRRCCKGILVGALIFSIAILEGCPFASYKRGRFTKKSIVTLSSKANSKEIISQMSKRYDIALAELQYQCPYDLLELKQKIKTLEDFTLQTEVHVEKKALRMTARALKLVLDKDFQSHLTGRDRYKEFIESMRVAIEHNQMAQWKDPKIEEFISEILQNICFSHFTINLNSTAIGYQYFWEVVPKELAQLDISELNVKLLNKVINKMYGSSKYHILLSKWNQKLHSPFFASWDGALASMRSKMATYQWHGRNISLLRMSCPVYGKNYHSSIDPMFTEYLKAIKKQHKKHLYLCNLDTTASSYTKQFKVGRLLQKLSESPEFNESMLFIILPVESAFYKQGNLGLLRASYFKETFLNSMLLRQEGFYFPSALLMDVKFVSFLTQILEDIHKTIFDDREFLERIERCQFIDIAYVYIAKYLIDQYQIDYVSWSGDNGIDYSMGAVALFDMLIQSMSSSSIHLDSTIYISFWPAFVHCHRHPSTTSTVRCYSAIQKLLERNTPSTLGQVSKEEMNGLEL